MTELVSHAVQISNFVRVDMEGSPYTQRTLDRQLHRQPGHAARSAHHQDLFVSQRIGVNQLLSERIRIRLCKGAYKEPPEIAAPRADVMPTHQAGRAAEEWVYHGLATHDERSSRRWRFARAENIPPTAYEFQMLHGVRVTCSKLVRGGYGLRVYIPFGTGGIHIMRRLAERPANVFFIARNMFRQ